MSTKLHWSGVRPPDAIITSRHIIARTQFGRFVLAWSTPREPDRINVLETPWEGKHWGYFADIDNAMAWAEGALLLRLSECADTLGARVFSAEESAEIEETLWAARCDIWQTLRVAEYNLTGSDPNFPEDTPAGPPEIKKLVHRKGVDESKAVCERVCATLAVVAKRNQAKVPDLVPRCSTLLCGAPAAYVRKSHYSPGERRACFTCYERNQHQFDDTWRPIDKAL